MKVYTLSKKQNKDKPFYVGITNNPKQRLKQHKYNLKQHYPYITSPNDLHMQIIDDTGTVPHEKKVAEKLETKYIHKFNTVQQGSNKVYYPHEHLKPHKLKPNPEKAKRTRQKKKLKKIIKILQLLKKEPWLSQEEITSKTGYSMNVLQTFAKEYEGIKAALFLEKVRMESITPNGIKTDFIDLKIKQYEGEII